MLYYYYCQQQAHPLAGADRGPHGLQERASLVLVCFSLLQRGSVFWCTTVPYLLSLEATYYRTVWYLLIIPLLPCPVSTTAWALSTSSTLDYIGHRRAWDDACRCVSSLNTTLPVLLLTFIRLEIRTRAKGYFVDRTYVHVRSLLFASRCVLPAFCCYRKCHPISSSCTTAVGYCETNFPLFFNLQ